MAHDFLLGDISIVNKTRATNTDLDAIIGQYYNGNFSRETIIEEIFTSKFLFLKYILKEANTKECSDEPISLKQPPNIKFSSQLIIEI